MAEFLISRKNDLVSNTFSQIDFKNRILDIFRNRYQENYLKSKLALPKVGSMVIFILWRMDLWIWRFGPICGAGNIACKSYGIEVDGAGRSPPLGRGHSLGYAPGKKDATP